MIKAVLPRSDERKRICSNWPHSARPNRSKIGGILHVEVISYASWAQERMVGWCQNKRRKLHLANAHLMRFSIWEYFSCRGLFTEVATTRTTGFVQDTWASERGNPWILKFDILLVTFQWKCFFLSFQSLVKLNFTAVDLTWRNSFGPPLEKSTIGSPGKNPSGNLGRSDKYTTVELRIPHYTTMWYHVKSYSPEMECGLLKQHEMRFLAKYLLKAFTADGFWSFELTITARHATWETRQLSTPIPKISAGPHYIQSDMVACDGSLHGTQPTDIFGGGAKCL